MISSKALQITKTISIIIVVVKANKAQACFRYPAQETRIISHTDRKTLY